MIMPKNSSLSWTTEKLKALDLKQLQSLRGNAVRLGAGDLIQLCDDELQTRRVPKASRVGRTQPEHSETDVVTGYHFVCGRGLGVIEIEGGRFWSGSWVVADDNVRNSIKYGAYLALHEKKSDFSYRQGRIIDYRRSPRDMVSKTGDGIEFLVQGTREPYNWVGAGAGEKGYQWTQLSTRAGNRPGQGKASSP